LTRTQNLHCLCSLVHVASNRLAFLSFTVQRFTLRCAPCQVNNSEYPPWKLPPQPAGPGSQFTSRHSIMHEISIVFSAGYDPLGNYVAAQPCSYLPNLFSCQTSCSRWNNPAASLGRMSDTAAQGS